MKISTIGWFLIAMAAMTRAAAARDAANAPPAALPDYLVGHNLPSAIAALERSGCLSEAAAAIKETLAGRKTRPDAPLVIEQERLARLQRDYSLTRDNITSRIRAVIPDLTEDDVTTWTAAHHLQWLKIDGQIRYFRREPANLFRLNAKARTRRDLAAKAGTAIGAAADPAGKSSQKFSLTQHIAKALAAADATSEALVLPTRIRATHTITVNAGAVPPGKTIRCWMPFPQEYHQQTDVRLLATTPTAHILAPNGAPHRTVYLEQPAADAGPTTFSVACEWTIAAFVPAIDPSRVVAPRKPPAALAQYLAEQPPQIVLTPQIRKLAAEIVGAEKNPLVKTQKIFHWMDKNIHYCSEMEYAVMPSVLEKIAAVRSGDCGAQALMFIALCRASGVPARWQSGWVTRPGNWNMHDWAEFYVKPWGWLVADPSIGMQKSRDPRVANFLIGHMDSYRMIANHGVAMPLSPAKTFWRSDPVDNQRGEVEWQGGNLYYNDWTYDVKIEFTATASPAHK